MKTADEIRAEFDYCGVTITAWALRNGFSPSLVQQVLSGKRKANRGQSRQIAVALGLREGLCEDFLELEKRTRGEPSA